ncbi:MAG TPA: hypothetical protein VFR23_13860 [Jiangellaceae bacterium]|nr:hypothetical protein [Jiangellaceae bacterium]
MSENRRAMLRGVLTQPAGVDDALSFTASSTSLNRYGFALRHDGWRIDNYNNNPVFLWMHMDFMPPIGRGRASLQNGQLVNTVTFDRSDPFAATIEQKYRGGFLNAVSVGFDFVDKAGRMLKDWWRMSADQIRGEAFYDLAEVSAVPVPADPRALVKQRGRLAAGLMDDLFYDADVSELADLLAAPLDPAERAKPGLLVPPSAPVLPGNSPVEQRLAELEAGFTAMRIRLVAKAVHHTATEDSEWDSSAAVAAMPEQAATLWYTHAWRDPDGDPDAKQTYKFPHHRTNGGPANLAACRAILSGRGAQADIPEAELEAARRHAQAHLDDAANNESYSPDAVQSLLAAATITL